MSFNGSGTFVINSTGQPVVANTVISATVFNALTADLASGLTNCITKDGQSTPTANIPMGSNKITGLANGTLIGDAANLGQVQSTVAKLISITGTDTVLGTMSPTLTAYAAGQLFYFVAGGANTGAVTLNVDGLGAKAITRDGSTALAAGDINSGEIVVVIYDGTRFQMINAANSFGNTTINGTLTVTGNTGLQANVSVTSALSVGGTFAVTGAATLGSTLAVTGKSDLPTVSTASANAAVAVITDLSAAGASITSANVGTAVVTTGTVTNLTATSASVASVNAGVALLTTATVTNLTATGASIASANLGNAVISALTLTGVSVASANVGVANITDLRAVGASVTSANLGTAVVTNGTVTNLTATSASVASVNAAVALLTTATVTTLTASGASIASANIGNLQFTAASIASINAGVAVINNLTATSASIASANVGTAVITTGTVTNLTSTAASVASANVGVALITTGTVTTLTATGASVASANVGTAVVTGLTVTNASVASLNAGTATITTGNLTFSSTAQRITGDMSNATHVNRLSFQSSVTNGATSPFFIPNGTGTSASVVVANASDPTNSSFGQFIANGSTDVRVTSGILGTGTYLPMTFYTGGSERVRIDTSGNTGFGGTAQGNIRVHALGDFPILGGNATSTAFGATGTIPTSITSTARGFYTSLTTAASFTLSNAVHFQASNVNVGAGSTVTNQFGFLAGSGLNTATNNYGFYGDIASGSNRYNVYMAGTADNYFAGNVGIGTASPASRLHVVDALSGGQLLVANDTANAAEKYGTFGTQHYTNAEEPALGMALQSSATENNVLIGGALGEFNAATSVKFFTAANNTTTSGTQRMVIDSSGNVGIGGTAAASVKLHILGTLPSSGGNSFGMAQDGTFPSGATSTGQIFRSVSNTAAASFTLPGLWHYFATQGTIGAGSTVTNQYGFFAESTLTGATNNFGFYSNIASGSNRWNFYAAGTARNYFAGNTGVGRDAGTDTRFAVRGSDATSSNYAVVLENSAAATLFYVRNDGLIFTGLAALSPYNTTTANAANVEIASDGIMRRSTSSLRYKSDVTDAAHGLADVLKLRSVTYKGKNDGDKVFGGLIAEEVHDAGLTEFVAYDKEGRPDAIHYGNMVALLVKAVQELTARVAELEAK